MTRLKKLEENKLVNELNKTLKEYSFNFVINKESTIRLVGKLKDIKTNEETDLTLLKTHLYSACEKGNLKSFSELLIQNHKLNIELFKR